MTENHFAYIFKGTGSQIIAAMAGTIGAISDGMQYGWTAPIIPLLNSPESPIKIVKSDENWLELIYLLGGVAGLPLTIYLINKIGRKNSTLVSSCGSLIAWILIGIADRVEYLYVARFLTGAAGDMAFVATPMYVAEIADQKVRGFLSAIIYLMMLFGLVVIYSLAPFVPFYVPSIVGGVLLSVQLVTFSFQPKSPYYLLTKNKVDEARKSLDRLRSRGNNDKELEEMQRSIERQHAESKGRVRDLLAMKNNRKALLIMTVLNGTQHFCGISVLLMNLHSILTQAKSSYFDAKTSAIIFALIMLLSASCTCYTIDRYGRKVMLNVSAFLTGICLILLAVYFHFQAWNFNMDRLSWMPVVCVMIYAAVFKFGLGMVPIVVSAEIFSNKVKATGMTISDAMYLLFSVASIEIYEQLSESYGLHVPFYIFGGCAFATVFFGMSVLPETKGKTLEEIQMLLKGELYSSDVEQRLSSPADNAD